jgi:hypothetical protein
MTIKTKLLNLHSAEPVLVYLGEEKLSFQIGFELSKKYQVIGEVLEFGKTKRIDILKELSGDKLKEDGNTYDVPLDKLGELNTRIHGLYNEEITLEIMPFKISDFKGIEISVNDLSKINFLFEQNGPTA